MPKSSKSAPAASTSSKPRRRPAIDTAAASRAAAEANFSSNRIAEWDMLFGRALRLDVLLADFRQCYLDNDWHFENFKTNARAMTVSFEKQTVDVDLSYEMAQRLDSYLCTGQDLVNDFLAKLEQIKRQREELLARKNATLNLLSPEQRTLLGLPQVFVA